MSVNRNAMAVALIKEGKTENDLFIALDDMRSLSMRILADKNVKLESETRAALQNHVDTLKPILNATFRPTGINSDPFVPRYRVVKIEHFSNDLGFIVMALDEDGSGVLKPFINSNNPETRSNIGYPAFPPLDLDDNDRIPEAELKELATKLVKSLAHEYELPLREPYVIENSNLEYALNETLEDMFPAAPKM